MKAVVRRSLERLMKRRIRHRNSTKISNREAHGLAKLAELMHDDKVEREAALNAAIARHPAGKQIPVQVVILPADLPCMRCNNKQPMDGRIWCSTCADIVDNQPAEPIEAAR